MRKGEAWKIAKKEELFWALKLKFQWKHNGDRNAFSAYTFPIVPNPKCRRVGEEDREENAKHCTIHSPHFAFEPKSAAVYTRFCCSRSRCWSRSQISSSSLSCCCLTCCVLVALLFRRHGASHTLTACSRKKVVELSASSACSLSSFVSFSFSYNLARLLLFIVIAKFSPKLLALVLEFCRWPKAFLVFFVGWRRRLGSESVSASCATSHSSEKRQKSRANL